MAEVLRGKRRGQEVGLHQFSNDWMMLDDGSIVRPSSLLYTTDEMNRILADKHKGIMLQLFTNVYDDVLGGWLLKRRRDNVKNIE